MQIPKPTDADKQRFKHLAPDGAGVEVKPMFGNLGAFVNGNMFMGLFGADIGIKLPDDQHAELLAQPKALAHVAALPPKAPKKRPADKSANSTGKKRA